MFVNKRLVLYVFILLWEAIAILMGIRKAQVFSMRSSGLGQPSNHYEKPALSQASNGLIFAHSFEGLVRTAIEQIRCCFPLRNAIQRYD